jgi:hypothetical protein
MSRSEVNDPDGLLGLAGRGDAGVPAVDDEGLERLLRAALSSEAEADPSLLPRDVDAPPFGEADGVGEPSQWLAEREDASPTEAQPGGQDPGPAHGDGDPPPGFEDGPGAGEQDWADDRDAGEHHEHGDDPWSAGQ